MSLPKTLTRMRAKATITAVDAVGVKGVTAYIVSLVAPTKQISITIR